jgi:hypothetical protein
MFRIWDLRWRVPVNLKQEGVLKLDADWSIPDYLEELFTRERQLAVELVHLYLHDSALCLNN